MGYSRGEGNVIIELRKKYCTCSPAEVDHLTPRPSIAKRRSTRSRASRRQDDSGASRNGTGTGRRKCLAASPGNSCNHIFFDIIFTTDHQQSACYRCAIRHREWVALCGTEVESDSRAPRNMSARHSASCGSYGEKPDTGCVITKLDLAGWWSDHHMTLAVGLLWSGMWGVGSCPNPFRGRLTAGRELPEEGQQTPQVEEVFLLFDADAAQETRNLWEDARRYMIEIANAGQKGTCKVPESGGANDAGVVEVIDLVESPTAERKVSRLRSSRRTQVPSHGGGRGGVVDSRSISRSTIRHRGPSSSELQRKRRVLHSKAKRLCLLHATTTESDLLAELLKRGLKSGVWCHETLLLPFWLDGNHWVGVAVTGMRRVARALRAMEDGERTGRPLTDAEIEDLFVRGSQGIIRNTSTQRRSSIHRDRRTRRQQVPHDDENNTENSPRGMRLVFLDSLRDSPLYASKGTVASLAAGRSLSDLLGPSRDNLTAKNPLATGAPSKSKADGVEPPSAHLSIAVAVLSFLASEWTFTERQGRRTRQLDVSNVPQEEESTGKTPGPSVDSQEAPLVRDTGKDNDWLTRYFPLLLKYTDIVFPSIPQQADGSQCGPMTMLALKAFAEDSSFRSWCLEGVTIRPTRTTPDASCGRQGPKRPLRSRASVNTTTSTAPYSFGTSFDVRFRLMLFLSLANRSVGAELDLSG